MPKTKTIKKTKSKRVSPIDARLQRVFDLLETAYAHLDSEDSRKSPTFDVTVKELVEVLRGGLWDFEGAKRTILALAVDADAKDLQECVEIAEKHHLAICVCCRSNTRAA